MYTKHLSKGHVKKYDADKTPMKSRLCFEKDIYDQRELIKSTKPLTTSNMKLALRSSKVY